MKHGPEVPYWANYVLHIVVRVNGPQQYSSNTVDTFGRGGGGRIKKNLKRSHLKLEIHKKISPDPPPGSATGG